MKFSFSCEQLLRKKRKVYDHVELEIKGSQVDGVHFWDTSFNWNVYSKKLKITIIWFTFGSKSEGKTVLFWLLFTLRLPHQFCFWWKFFASSETKCVWRSSHCQPFQSISELLHFDFFVKGNHQIAHVVLHWNIRATYFLAYELACCKAVLSRDRFLELNTLL